MRYFITFSLFFIYISTANASQLRTIKWKISSNKDNISIFTPVNYKHKSGLIPIRFKATLNHNVSRVLSVFVDEKIKPNGYQMQVR